MAFCRFSNLILALGTLCQGPVVIRAAAETNTLQFTQPAPYTTEEEIGRRFGYGVVPPDYDLSRERFRVQVPSPQGTNSVHGLLVWLNSGDDGYFPPVWEEELTNHNLVLIAPLQCGDGRHPIDRLRMALDGTCNACRKYRIDRKRIYVGGFAGGARLASMLGIACGDIFTGALCICGVNFHLHVPVDGAQYYPGSFYPSPEVVQYARTKGRFVLITGEGDPDFDRIKAIAELGFRRDGFKNVLLQQAPGVAQATPQAGFLEQALAFLDATTPSASPTTSTQALPRK
jgi:predicted esterase